MTTTDDVGPGNPPTTETPPKQARPRATLWILRVVAALHLLSLAAQPLLAGFYLGGDFDALNDHAMNGLLAILLVMVQFVAALAYAWPGGGARWPLLLALVQFLAEGMQLGMGHARMLGVHLPLGVVVLGAQLVFTVWAFRAAARRPRRRRAERDRRESA